MSDLLFQTGFEPGTCGLPAAAHEVFTGVDHSVAPPNDWELFRRRLPPPHPWALPGAPAIAETSDAAQLGYFDIQYLGGTPEQRFARIIEDPTCPGNHLLHFSITQANETFPGGSKARVQACIYANRHLTALTSRVRMYLHPDLAALRDWEAGFDWLTLQEYWFGPEWDGGTHPFRISLGLGRAPGPGRKELYVNLQGQPAWEGGMPLVPAYAGWGWPTWEAVQRAFPVPIGVWLECETRYRMGDAATGCFTFRVRPHGGDWAPIFDIRDWTYNPRAPAPQPLYGWSPMKLYTSAALVDYVRSRGGVTQLYWDDLAIAGWD
jgi:hypothetical protein